MVFLISMAVFLLAAVAGTDLLSLDVQLKGAALRRCRRLAVCSVKALLKTTILFRRLYCFFHQFFNFNFYHIFYHLCLGENESKA